MNKNVLLFLVLVGYGAMESAASDILPDKYEAEPPPITLESFARALSDYMSIGETGYLANYVYMPSVLETTIQKLIAASKSNVNAMDESRMRNALSSRQFSVLLQQQIAQQFSGSEYWTYLNHRLIEGRHAVLYRIEQDDVFNYLELTLSRIADLWVIVDFYNYGLDASLTDSMGASLALLGELAMSDDNQAVKDFINSAMTNSARCLELFPLLPDEFKNRHFIQSTLLKASSLQSNQHYIKAIETVVDVAPENRFILAKMGYFFERQDYPRTLEYVDQLDSMVGGDLQLALVRAEVFKVRGMEQQYYDSLVNILKDFPENMTAFFSVLVMLAGEKKYEDAVLVLEVLRDDFGQELDAEIVPTIEGLEEFIMSAEYKNWLEASS